MGYRKIKLDCASVCSDARSRGQSEQSCHCANLLIMLILRDKNSVLILCIIVVAVFFVQGSMCVWCTIAYRVSALVHVCGGGCVHHMWSHSHTLCAHTQCCESL